mmetsp:Transcript_43339/g.104745  ORF Transcript_43339/g.104745 Transcript_43339/m.104745 type:complete len:81 (+) Transcript_43339:160-402(+)
MSSWILFMIDNLSDLFRYSCPPQVDFCVLAVSRAVRKLATTYLLERLLFVAWCRSYTSPAVPSQKELIGHLAALSTKGKW